MDHDKAIDKIKKCLALAGSSNPNEAATAMRQAQKLMAEHGLTQLDVEIADVGEKQVPANSNLLSTWDTNLARTVADAFGCDFFIQRGSKRLFMGPIKRTTDFVFVGIGASPEIASYAYRVLHRQCAKDRSDHVKSQSKRLKATTRSARGDAFAVAWVSAVRDLLDNFAGNTRHAELIKSYLDREHGEMSQANVKRREVSRHVKDDSYLDGMAAGKKAQLHNAVGAGKKTELIGRGK